ncbi:h+ nucleoside cotransporter [Moniliophthora roreri MCA 2997]|uniref:H+ nucleoside cotransporter n=2 Tax=Moniliophthora roreri TaxID=221103 RepID=V2WVT8_MONRO|nr:h+ nucleoside cotransporter [Moniliophthora roreri MCA 2997]KAI3596992.1 h+ nucleoside cotransporter [Moniliophthora roreri]
MATFADPPRNPATELLPVQRRPSQSSGSLDEKRVDPDPEVVLNSGEDRIQLQEAQPPTFYQRFRPLILAGIAAVILGWWISATVLKATRHRWIVQTLWAWFFILVIAFRYIPNRVVTKPVGATWETLVSSPFFKLPYKIRLGLGWLALIAIVFGSAFGFSTENGTSYADRGISVAGLVFFQLCFFISSRYRSHIPWPTVIVGLFAQQAVALFVLKTGAGFSIFKWIATLAADFLAQAEEGAAFFFSAEVVANHWFFVNTLSAIIFFIAFIQALYYLGVMQWVLGKFAWFFFKIMNISGAEAVVAASSPWIGQGESACLVRPYVDLMTTSELHLTMTSGFSCIAGSVMAAYIQMGVPAENIVTSSVMSIPASIAISKIRFPELDEPVTRGRVIVDRGEEKNRPTNVVHAFSNGAVFGLIVAGQILTNVLTVIALVAAINGLLTWIGRGFGIAHLTIQLVLKYVLYPITFFMGVPRNEILRVSELLATKLVANEFVAYSDLKVIMNSSNPLSQRAHTIATYALCGFANLGSLGIQIGVLGAMAPSKKSVIAKIAFSAMVCGFLSTMQTAGIAGMLV